MFRGILDYSHRFLRSSVTATLFTTFATRTRQFWLRIQRITADEGEQEMSTEGFCSPISAGLSEFMAWQKRRGVLALKWGWHSNMLAAHPSSCPHILASLPPSAEVITPAETQAVVAVLGLF